MYRGLFRSSFYFNTSKISIDSFENFCERMGRAYEVVQIVYTLFAWRRTKEFEQRRETSLVENAK